MFKIKKLIENSKIVKLKLKFKPSIINYLVLYYTLITLRSKKHKELIKKIEKNYL
jgi:hypothetical protein